MTRAEALAKWDICSSLLYINNIFLKYKMVVSTRCGGQYMGELGLYRFGI
ncbi:hypothetical protein HanIR_Chr17g0900061 [Helianthus annuus]|nr:hypothetical protein HanIR_Chr17g0900061 [Helianthus annuus]